jgi:hypothetical protein
MARFSLVLVLLLTLTLLACTGGGERKVECKEQYWDGTVGLCLPEGWQVIGKEALAAKGIPEEVAVAFQKESPISGQFPTVTVTQEPLQGPANPVSYSEAGVRTVSVLPGYKLLDTDALTIDGEEITLHIFTAQPVASEPARRFYQVSSVSKEVGFTVTGVMPLSIESDLEREMIVILRSFTLKKPVKEEEE